MEGARDFRERAREQASEYAEKTREQASRLAGQARESAQEMRDRVAGGDREGRTQEESVREDFQRGREEAGELGREAAELAGEIGTLVQQEVQLAKAELAQQMGSAVRSVASGMIAALFSMLMLIFLSVGVMLAFGLILDLWIAAFVTTGILAVLAFATGLFGIGQMRKIRLVPERTVQSVQEDVEWARNQMTSSKK